MTPPPPDVWASGTAYERYIGRWSRLVAGEFLSWLAPAPALRWLDVGCGTGALTALVLERTAPRSVVGVDPASAFVARFLGFENLLPARVIRSGRRSWLETPIGKFPSPVRVSGEVTVLLRPDAIRLGRKGTVRLKGKLIKKQFHGQKLQARIEIGKTKLVIDLPSDAELPPIGKTVAISFDPKEAMQVFARE